MSDSKSHTQIEITLTHLAVPLIINYSKPELGFVQRTESTPIWYKCGSTFTSNVNWWSRHKSHSQMCFIWPEVCFRKIWVCSHRARACRLWVRNPATPVALNYLSGLHVFQTEILKPGFGHPASSYFRFTLFHLIRKVIFPFSFFSCVSVYVRARVCVPVYLISVIKRLAHVRHAFCFFSILPNLKGLGSYDIIPSYVLDIVLFLTTPQRQTPVTSYNDLCTIPHCEQF